MIEPAPAEERGAVAQPNIWRGVDFSGFTLILGVGTGRLIELLNEQAEASSGNLVVISPRADGLKALEPLKDQGPLTPIRARTRQIPVLSETIDLLVVNGVLREVPSNRLTGMFEEIWRVLVPGGRLRISDIIEPSEAGYNRAWAERNRVVRKLGTILDRPTALAVDLQQAARAMRAVGFEKIGVQLLPGYALTDAWLEETVSAIRSTAGQVADRRVRQQILEQDLNLLITAYTQGGQRAAERFVLYGSKAGDLALDMEASFTEKDLQAPDDW